MIELKVYTNPAFWNSSLIKGKLPNSNCDVYKCPSSNAGYVAKGRCKLCKNISAAQVLHPGHCWPRSEEEGQEDPWSSHHVHLKPQVAGFCVLIKIYGSFDCSYFILQVFFKYKIKIMLLLTLKSICSDSKNRYNIERMPDDYGAPRF